jgi:hypothetical protein
MTVFVDDFSTQNNASDHLQYVREALIRCRKMQLALNPDNTFLGVNRGVLLGYVVSDKGRELDPEKIEAISEMTTPTNVKRIVKFLEHVGWYRELIPDFTKIAAVIIHLLKKDVRFEWTEACQRAFEELWNKLSTYPVLRPPDWNKHFYVFCDASNVMVDSALCQSMGRWIKINPLTMLVSN